MSQTNDAAPAAPADGAPATPPAGNDASLLQQGQGTENSWLPEKYRVKVEGTDELDLPASSRKLGEAYKALETKLGSGATGTVPATADDYQLTVPTDAEGKPLIDGVDLEDFKGDPIYKDLAAKAHAAGIPNETMQFFIGEYLQFMPQVLQANVQLGAEDAKQALSTVWKDEAAMGKGLQQAARAAQGFGSEAGQLGSFDNLMQKFGNDPDFLAFAARIGSEMGEDKPISSDPAAQQDWQAQLDDLRTQPGYSDQNHPQHKHLMQKKADLYQRRFGTQQRQLGGAATR